MDGQKFAEYKKLDLAKINLEVLSSWEEKNLFHLSMEIKKNFPVFVFYEGPPSANGKPGIHHVMARSIKDVFCRYKTMKGYLVRRKAGWDTHGLPVELEAEKALKIKKGDIGQKISIKDYNSFCKQIVMKYTKEWEDLTRIIGFWIDMENSYVTCENQYIETIWWILKEFYKKGLLYKGSTIQPYSPAAGTGLSIHELNQPGCYREVKDTACIAQFKILNPVPKMSKFGDAFFLVWTTTPWTLPSNTALCVGPDIEYIAVQSYNVYSGTPITVILSKNSLYSYFDERAKDLSLDAYCFGNKLIPFKVIGSWKGKELIELTYEQLIPCVKLETKIFRVIVGNFVNINEGTGIVHIAPTFGVDDYKIAEANGIFSLKIKDKEGVFRPMVDTAGKFFRLEELDKSFVKKNINVCLYREFAGRFVKNSYNDHDKCFAYSNTTLDLDICKFLKKQNRVFKIANYIHSYPHCWRTDKPILYYPLDSWFIRTTAFKNRMIELNNTIHWKPQFTGQGRFGKWLENLQDWNLSRSRYWGTPLPIWKTKDGLEIKCIGSIHELMQEIQRAIEAGVMFENPYQNLEKMDLHRPYVDEIILISELGKPMKRETDLVDVWFDSGAMPYAQIHYPFDNSKEIDQNVFFPADFISEGIDQTRGWFFTLHAISVMMKDSVAFKNVISNGLVLDKNGNKMSKRLKNTIDPFEVIQTYGSDSLRWYMITNALPWDNLKFDQEGIESVSRKFFNTLYNTYAFFATYANVDGFDPNQTELSIEIRPEIDRWILSLLHSLIKNVDNYLGTYNPTYASRAINHFVNEHLSNWYIRLNRKRFWVKKMNIDKLSAYQTLYTCLKVVAQLIAPIAPFYADKLYLDLVQKTQISVHLSNFPVFNKQLINKFLEKKVQIAQDLSSMVLALRRKIKIKVRQPLSTIMIPILNYKQKESIASVESLILKEVNVKTIRYVYGTNEIFVKKIKPNFKKLGPRYGKTMKSLAKSLAEIDQITIFQLEKKKEISLIIDNQMVKITLDDVEIIFDNVPGWLVTNNGKWTVALDVTITDSLKKEGLARELINRIQHIRKSKKYEITDRIKLIIHADSLIKEVIIENKSYIASQVLADSIIVSDYLMEESELIIVNGVKLQINIAKTVLV